MLQDRISICIITRMLERCGELEFRGWHVGMAGVHCAVERKSLSIQRLSMRIITTTSKRLAYASQTLRDVRSVLALAATVYRQRFASQRFRITRTTLAPPYRCLPVERARNVTVRC